MSTYLIACSSFLIGYEPLRDSYFYFQQEFKWVGIDELKAARCGAMSVMILSTNFFSIHANELFPAILVRSVKLCK